MPTSKLSVKQFNSSSGETFLIYRYFDNHLNNYEYQIYQLVESREVARKFGISEFKEERTSELNTREMCDILWEMRE